MQQPRKLFSAISEMVGRRAWIARGSPTAPAAADLLDDIGERWSCWRLRSERAEHHRHRLQLHLHTISIAIEDDLALLDTLDPMAIEKSDAR